MSPRSQKTALYRIPRGPVRESLDNAYRQGKNPAIRGRIVLSLVDEHGTTMPYEVQIMFLEEIRADSNTVHFVGFLPELKATMSATYNYQSRSGHAELKW